MMFANFLFFPPPFFSIFVSKTGSLYYVAQAVLELTIYSRLASNSKTASLCLPSAGNRDVCHHMGHIFSFPDIDLMPRMASNWIVTLYPLNNPSSYD